MDQNKKAGHFDEKMLNPKVKSEDGECQMSAKYDNEEKHPTWSRHAEFFFCTLGGCVGFGNLWRFPYLCMRNGGGAFLIPYILFLVICAIPMVYMESLLGQFSGYGYLAQWNICPLFKGAGHLSTLLNLTWLVYFAVIVAWSLYYVGSSFAPNVPWATCDNEWNTPSCWDFSNNTAPASNLSTELAVNRSALGVSYLRENASSINGSSVFVVKRTTPAEEFFE